MAKPNTPWHIEEIQPWAQEIVEKLKPFCNQIEIAGSIRRKKATVYDVELVVVAKTQPRTVLDLFAPPKQELEPVQQFIDAVKMLGEITKGDPKGRHVQIQTVHDFQLDLFITSKEDFGRQLAIRTGPAEYSGKIIAGGWVKRGWCGTEDGLRKRKECTEKSGKWHCVVPRPTLPPPFLTEEFFFNFIGLKWIEPQFRYY